MERCDTCQYVEGLFDSHSASLRNCFLSPKGGMKSIRKVCQLIEV